ncbi:MAG: ComEC/Rec2 family competence protein [Candidatus Omnitrophota bacterium]
MERFQIKELVLFLVLNFLLTGFPGSLRSQTLEIHYINVGGGQSILIKGPDGTLMLIDGGRPGQGTWKVVPYLQSKGIKTTGRAIDYIINTHPHVDHDSGLIEVIRYGYNTRRVYSNGRVVKALRDATARTSAGRVASIRLGQILPLGKGATATCVAVNGSVIGIGAIPGGKANPNDCSVALLIKYGHFDYLMTGDLGGGQEDTACTGRSTIQANIETPLVNTMMPGGVHPLLSAYGVEVAHVGHHGNDSSTNKDYMNKLSPRVACLSTGGPISGLDHVLNVLLKKIPCVTAPPALVLQTEEAITIPNSKASRAGYCVGDMVITTDGWSHYTVSASGAVTRGPDERAAAGLPKTYALDEGKSSAPKKFQVKKKKIKT